MCVKMSDYPGLKIDIETRCACCDVVMPAGFFAAVVDGFAACTASCAVNLDLDLATSILDDLGELGTLRDAVSAKRSEVEALEEQLDAAEDQLADAKADLVLVTNRLGGEGLSESQAKQQIQFVRERRASASRVAGTPSRHPIA